MVGVAQLVEHPVVVRNVAGSSPVIHPNLYLISLLIYLITKAMVLLDI